MLQNQKPLQLLGFFFIGGSGKNNNRGLLHTKQHNIVTLHRELELQGQNSLAKAVTQLHAHLKH